MRRYRDSFCGPSDFSSGWISLLQKHFPCLSVFRLERGRPPRTLKGSTFRGCCWSCSFSSPWQEPSTGGVWKSATPYPTSHREREGGREKRQEGRWEGCWMKTRRKRVDILVINRAPFLKSQRKREEGWGDKQRRKDALKILKIKLMVNWIIP